MTDTGAEYTSEKHVNIWPKFPGNSQALVHGMLNQCLQTQWLSRQEILEGQMAQLNILLGYAKMNSPFYSRWLSKVDLSEQDLSAVWDEMPILELADITRDETAMAIDNLPTGHGAKQSYPITLNAQAPVPALTTGLWFIFLTAWIARIFHDHNWDRNATLIELYAGQQNGYSEMPGGWGGALASGKRISAVLASHETKLPAWISEISGDVYLMISADLLPLVIDATENNSLAGLKGMVVYVHSKSDMRRCEKAIAGGLSIIPAIMVTGLGLIASACPEHGKLHINTEAVLLEELEGRSLISILHNYATPIIRLDCQLPLDITGSCSCGRGAQVVEFNR